MTGLNTYLGITVINAGVLSISSDANLGIVPTSDSYLANQLTFNGGTLQATASFALNANRGITLLDGGGTIDRCHRRQYLELWRRDHWGRLAHQNRDWNAGSFWDEHLRWSDKW